MVPCCSLQQNISSAKIFLCFLTFHLLMRSTTQSTKSLLRTPSATLIMGRLCHSLNPTHSRLPAAENQ